MKLTPFFIILFIALNSFSQSEAHIPAGAYSQKEIKHIEKKTRQLKKLRYTKAVNKYGAPFENSKIELNQESLSIVLTDEQIMEHFPNLNMQQKGAYLKEASWKILESWITVWYIFENGKWKPINHLVTI